MSEIVFFKIFRWKGLNLYHPGTTRFNPFERPKMQPCTANAQKVKVAAYLKTVFDVDTLIDVAVVFIDCRAAKLKGTGRLISLRFELFSDKLIKIKETVSN